jgi:omega-amidase
MNLLLGQLDLVWEDPPANFARLEAMLREARPEAETLLVLPEMFPVGFSMNVARTAECVGGPSEQRIQAIARERQLWIISGQVTQAAGGRGFNEAIVVNPQGQTAGRYRKLHPFSFAREDEHFEPGKEIVTLPIGLLTVAPFVCYDLRFPEAFRHAVQRGAEMFVVIANWPATRTPHWVALLQARAIENQAFVVGVNRVGSDPKLPYGGRSLVIDPRGEILFDAGDAAGLHPVSINASAARAWRATFPALKDIRADLLPPPKSA